MSTDRVRHEIKRMIAETDRLSGKIRRVSEGLRYVRTQDKAEELYKQLREARNHVSLAQSALDGESEPEKAEDGQAHRSWLRERVAGISRALIHRAEAPTDEEGEGSEENRPGGFQGDSWSIPLPDLIGFIRTLAKTGELIVELHEEVVTRLPGQARVVCRGRREASLAALTPSPHWYA